MRNRSESHEGSADIDFQKPDPCLGVPERERDPGSAERWTLVSSTITVKGCQEPFFLAVEQACPVVHATGRDTFFGQGSLRVGPENGS